MDRLDKIEKRNTILSSVILLYTIAITLIIYGVSQENGINIYTGLGIVSYVVGFFWDKKHKLGL